MAIAHDDVAQFPLPVEGNGEQQKSENMHRISTVRRQQGVSLRTVARQLSMDMATVRAQEDETADLKISDLVAWQKVLNVPLNDLLVDPGAPLSRPVLERARMVRLMKTAAAMEEQAEDVGLQRMARMLVDQLKEIMPELEEVGPWHSVGQRRSLDEFGSIVDRRIKDDWYASQRD